MIGGLALAVGLLASYMVLNQLKNFHGGNQLMLQAFVAAHDIEIGAKLQDSDLRLASFPQSSTPSDAFSRKSHLLGRGVVLPISKGDFILPNKLAAEDAGSGLPSMIPPGMRAVSVRVNDVVSVAGFVQPGTRVDVLSTGNEASGNERQTITVLENVAVIAVGKNLDRNSPSDATPAPVITLLVSPSDAQKLTLASTEGRIQLSLRNPLDTRQASVGATRTSSLYLGQTTTTAQAKPKPRKVEAKNTPPPAPYQVEMIRGSKRDETKF